MSCICAAYVKLGIVPTRAVCSCQDALEALGEEDAACLQEQLKGGAPAKLTAAEGQVFEVTPAMVDISRVQKKVAGRCAGTTMIC